MRDMNKQELIKSLKFTRNNYSNGNTFRGGVSTGLGIALGEIDQLDEPEKLVIPRFVATFIEDSRNKVGCIVTAIWEMYDYEYKHVYEWVLEDGNDEVLMKAFANGYEIEKEKLYYVINGAQQLMLANTRYIVPTLTNFEVAIHEGVLKKYQLTEKEIKEYDARYWPFAEEVTE